MPTDLQLIIGNKAYSSWSMRPWIAMTANGLNFRETVIRLGHDTTAAEVKKFSPSGKVPCLIHGDIKVWDSLAILEYLAEAFYDKPWWPTDPQARAMARSVSAEMHSGFQGLRQNMPMNVRRSYPGRGQVPDALADISRISAIWAECRKKFGATGPYLFGAFSNADAMYAPVVTRFKTYCVTLDPVCRAYADAVLDHPALRRWYAEAMQEPWVEAKYELD